MKRKKSVCGRKTLWLLLLALLAFPLQGSSQYPRVGLLVSNNVISLPVTGYPKIFYSQFHPGLDLFYGFQVNKNAKHQLWINLDAGGYYHRFFQTGIRIHGQFDYRYVSKHHITAGAGVMAGYLHSFSWYEIFTLNDDGEYEQIPKLRGRPQAIGGFRLGCSFPVISSHPGEYALHIDFRTYLQAPFAGEYIPVIPSNSFMIGISKNLHQKKATNENR